MPQSHSSQTGMARAGDGMRVQRSRVFTAPRWPLATSDHTHNGDVAVQSGPSLVYQYERQKE